MIAVCSLFRDNVDDVARCFNERSLWNIDDELLHVCVEGDSVDGTYEALAALRDKHRILLHKQDVGKPRFPSVVDSERLAILARLSNMALDLAIAHNPSHIMWLDSDVSTSPDMVRKLKEAGKDIIAPMFFFEKSSYFRDTWGYRALNGDQFTNRPRYCRNYDQKRPFEVSSVGLPLIDAKVVKAGARFTDEEMVGFCGSARALGFRIYCHPLLEAFHPRNGVVIPPLFDRL